VRFLRRIAGVLLAAGCVTTGGAPAPPDAATREAAARALEGDGSDLFHAEEKIERVARGLARIRRDYAEVREIGPGPGGMVTIRLREDAWRRSAMGGILTGLPAVDSVSRLVRVVRVHRGGELFRDLTMVLAPEVNTPVAGARYAALPEVESAHPPLLLGDGGGSLRVRSHGDSLVYHFSQGWGDCLSGCIYHRGWTFSYDPRTGRVRLLRDTGDPTPAAGYERWRRRADWAVFDTMPQDRRSTFAARLASDPRASRRLLAALIPRLTPGDFEVADTLLARPEVAASPTMVAGMARLPGAAGRQARAVLLDRHGLRIARDRTAPADQLRPLLEEFVRRDPPPRALAEALVRNATVRSEPALLLLLARELNHHPDLLREACAAYLSAGYPVWERAGDNAWSSAVPCPDLPPSPAR